MPQRIRCTFGQVYASIACEGFRVTQGWGSVGTIIVAVLAIIASSYWNYRTLQRSAATLELAERTFERTEEMHAADRMESRNEKLRDVLFASSRTLWRCNHTASQHVRLLDRLANLMKTDEPEDKRKDLHQQIRDNFETVRALCTDAVLELQTAVILSDWQSLRAAVAPLTNDLTTVPTIASRKTDLSSAEAVENAASRLRDANDELQKHMSGLTRVIANEVRPFVYKSPGHA
jgi:hypothetical protein